MTPRLGVVDPDNARREAQHILSGRRFRPSPAPRPLHGVLQWLGDRLRGLLDWIANHAGLSAWWEWVLFAALVLGGIVLLVARGRLGRRTRDARAPRATAGAGGVGDDADALERDADEAERDGDLERAVRLRFRAGLLRLGTRGAIRYRPSVTTGEVRRALGSPRFEQLAGTFEAVTYGGRQAARPDVDAARHEWPRVLEESARR